MKDVKEQVSTSIPNSVGGAAVPSLTNPDDVHALQKKRFKQRYKEKILKRARVKL